MSFLRRLFSRQKETSPEFEDDWESDEEWTRYQNNLDSRIAPPDTAVSLTAARTSDTPSDRPADLQHLAQRVAQLEARLDDLVDQSAHTPSHSDLLEVRIHSAKLAAELARTTVELRGEIGMATDEARRAAIRRSREDAEELVIDLREERLPVPSQVEPEARASENFERSESRVQAAPFLTQPNTRPPGQPVTPLSPSAPRNPFIDRVDRNSDADADADSRSEAEAQ